MAELKNEGVVTDYAIGGAMALVFWAEPIPTFDLDVFVLIPSQTRLVSLGPIYQWARQNRYPEEAEHIVIAGVPVQFIPAYNALTEEAIDSAAVLDYEGQRVRVIRPEHLVALYLEPGARTRKRLERVAALLEETNLDKRLLQTILERYNLNLPKHE